MCHIANSMREVNQWFNHRGKIGHQWAKAPFPIGKFSTRSSCPCSSLEVHPRLIARVSELSKRNNGHHYSIRSYPFVGTYDEELAVQSLSEEIGAWRFDSTLFPSTCRRFQLMRPFTHNLEPANGWGLLIAHHTRSLHQISHSTESGGGGKSANGLRSNSFLLL